MRAFWQPRSLLQLVLFSFFAALVPLSIAIWSTLQTLGDMAEENHALTRRVLEVTRLEQEIQRDILELERRARQHQALRDAKLAALFNQERAAVLHKLSLLQQELPTANTDLERLTASLQQLDLQALLARGDTQAHTPAQRLEDRFDTITRQRKAVKRWLETAVAQLLQQSAQTSEDHIEALILQLALLTIATLVLLLLLARWINKPVKDLKHEIHQLGTAGLSHPIEISGPLELQALGSELEWLRRRLHESEQQKQQFLRHISHELKTPLASLREGADLLAEQVTGHLSQQQQEIAEIVRQNGIELQRLLENLLDYNHLPHQELTLESFSVTDVLLELLTHYALTVKKKRLRLYSPSDDIEWTADRYKLKTTLDNLLSNAVNYTPAGGEIEIRTDVIEDNLEISVANSGQAIPDEDVERVFEPFVQSAAQRTGPMKGSGIGLSVARECMQAQGGNLRLIQHERLPICFLLQCPAHSLPAG